MANYIIECKNKTAVLNKPQFPNGMYNTTIQEKISLSSGDSIVLKSAFIDTEASSDQKIIIPEDLDLELTHINYMMNTFGKAHMAGVSEETILDSEGAARTVPDTPALDGEMYVLCQDGPEGDPIREIKEIVFQNANVKASTDFGNFDAYCNFTDFDGVKQSVKLNVKQYVFNPSKPITVESAPYRFNAIFDTTFPFNISAGDATDAGTGGNGTVLGGHNAPASGAGNAPAFNNTVISLYKQEINFPVANFWSVNMATYKHYEAVKFTDNIQVPQGNYQATDLCETINRELNKIGTNIGTSDLVDNQFLVSLPPASTYTFVQAVSTRATPPAVENKAGDFRYRYSVAGDPAIVGVWCGASQMTLSFDQSTQKFFWEYIHSPYYQNSYEAVGYFDAEDITGLKSIKPIDRHGGILFTELNANSTKTGTPSDFWTKSLGFNIDRSSSECMLVQYSAQNNITNPLPPATIGYRIPVFKPVFDPQPQVGINYTANYHGMDTAVQKADIGKPNSFPFIPALGQAGQATGSFFSTSQKTTTLDAGDSILSQDDRMTFGYYLIEVKANFNNNFITEDENRKSVMAIVSRFYEKDAYTNATEDASLIYTHQGEDMILSSFDIRILDSDKNLASNIGQDNTVFLNVIKSPPLAKKSKAIKN